MQRAFKEVCLIALLLIPSITRSQQLNAKLPENPRQFLDLATTVNGLASEKLGPWHIKATFQLLDQRGAERESGTYEAFWKSPLEYKMIYTSQSYNRTIWANASGNFATTDPRWPGDIEWMIRRSLFDVVPGGFDRDQDLHWRDATIGVKVKCIDTVPIYVYQSAQEIPFYCFDPGVPVIRFSSEVGRFYQATFNNIVSAWGVYIARDVELLHGGRAYFRLHLETLEPLSESGEDIFRADAAALPVARRMVVDSDLRDMHTTVMNGIPNSTNAIVKQPYVKTPMPNSPISSDREVIVEVLVNKKGKVADARAIRGDAFREVGAVSAARTWEFKPYVVQGEPMEFYTELEFF